jgi:2-methylcitrate dehydratase PrpD
MGLEGVGFAPLIGWGRTASASAAAVLNGTFIQGFELDDYHPVAPLHGAAVIVPALLSATQLTGAVDGSRFLLAAVLGFEVGPRVGLALHGGQMLSRGWHSGAVFGPFAAAAAAGCLLRIDAAQFEDALGLAATQASGLMAAQFEAMSKRMHHGLASRNGLFAAAVASAGYTGIKRVFEREYGGFLSTFGEGHAPDASQVFLDLGERWETERVAIKPHAAMGGLHGGIDAVLELAAGRALRSDDIEHIEVTVGEAVFHHGGWVPTRPLNTVGAQMNLAYAVAVTILDGAAFVEQFSPSRIDQDDVWDLIGRTAVRHDRAIDQLGADAAGCTRVRIKFRNGEVNEAVVEQPRGRPGRPLSNQEIVGKFRRLTSAVIEAERRDAIENCVLELESVGDVSELVALLAPPAGALFN